MFEGKTALVTGASRGIGREIAVMLAAQKAHVIVNYSGSEAAAEEVKKTIEDAGGSAETYQCNVGNFDDVKTMIDTIIKNHKTLDILVNNAGITRDNLLLKMSEKDFDDVININLKGVFNTVKHSVRYMIKQRAGRIINISSVAGISGNAGQTNYSASKAGVIGITKTLARELASRGITVNAVAPGFVRTDMTDALSDGTVQKALETIPLKKMGEPEDIANMVVYLASEKGKYITGQVIQVDGGIAI